MSIDDDALNEALSSMDPQVKKLVQDSKLQYDDANSILRDKSKDAVLDQSIYTRKVLVDTIFSLKTVCDDLFNAVFKIADKGSSSSPDMNMVLSKVEEMMNARFENLSQQLSCMAHQLWPQVFLSLTHTLKRNMLC